MVRYPQLVYKSPPISAGIVRTITGLTLSQNVYWSYEVFTHLGTPVVESVITMGMGSVGMTTLGFMFARRFVSSIELLDNRAYRINSFSWPLGTAENGKIYSKEEKPTIEHLDQRHLTLMNLRMPKDKLTYRISASRHCEIPDAEAFQRLIGISAEMFLGKQKGKEVTRSMNKRSSSSSRRNRKIA